MRFQWDRPYHVDASRFASAFWSDATPFETGVRETALAFRANQSGGAEPRELAAGAGTLPLAFKPRAARA